LELDTVKWAVAGGDDPQHPPLPDIQKRNIGLLKGSTKSMRIFAGDGYTWNGKEIRRGSGGFFRLGTIMPHAMSFENSVQMKSAVIMRGGEMGDETFFGDSRYHFYFLIWTSGGMYLIGARYDPSTSQMLYKISQSWDTELVSYSEFKTLPSSELWAGELRQSEGEARLKFWRAPLKSSETQGAWNMDEGSGGTIYDSSINAYHGTIIGALWDTDSPSGEGYSLLFDGVDDFVKHGNVLGFERDDQFSLEAWVKIANPDEGVYRSIMGKCRSVTIRGYNLNYHPMSNRLWFTIVNGAWGNAIGIYATVELGTDWNHIVATYDGSSSASGAKIYVNGTEQSTLVYADTLTDTIINDAEFLIGARGETGNEELFWNGKIDEVVVWDRVLSPSEISDRYNARKIPFLEEKEIDWTSPLLQVTSPSTISWGYCGYFIMGGVVDVDDFIAFDMDIF